MALNFYCIRNKIRAYAEGKQQKCLRDCIDSKEVCILENETCKKSKYYSNYNRNDSNQKELSQNLKRCKPLKCDWLKLKHSIEQNNRYDIIQNAFAKDAAENFRLFVVVNDTECSNNVWTAKDCSKE